VKQKARYISSANIGEYGRTGRGFGSGPVGQDDTLFFEEDGVGGFNAVKRDGRRIPYGKDVVATCLDGIRCGHYVLAATIDMDFRIARASQVLFEVGRVPVSQSGTSQSRAWTYICATGEAFRTRTPYSAGTIAECAEGIRTGEYIEAPDRDEPLAAVDASAVPEGVPVVQATVSRKRFKQILIP
jgi:hypothetical protein